MRGRFACYRLASGIAAVAAVSGNLNATQTEPDRVTVALAGEQLRGPAFYDVATLKPPLARAILAVLERRKEEDRANRAFISEIAEYYAGRDHAPIWLPAGSSAKFGTEPQADPSVLISRISRARRDGLDPNDYNLPALPPAVGIDVEAQAEYEIGVSIAAVRFLTHIAIGRIRPATISRIITLSPQQPTPAEILDALTSGEPFDAVIAAFEPPHPQYALLKALLVQLLEAPGPQPVKIPDGPALRPGMEDWRVPLLRHRLGFVATTASMATHRSQFGFANPTYDKGLAAVIRRRQAEAGLVPDGIVGPKTLAMLNGSSLESQVADIVLNMERWRWMPRELGAFHIRVNIPQFRLDVIRNGRSVHDARVVVGKTTNKTPVFSDEMEHMIVNPYWNVPHSILRNELLPSIRRNPRGYFARRRFEVVRLSGGRARKVDPASVNWSAAAAGKYRVRQRPGTGNALGRIKFMFPNRHSVYLHDTPSKSLFDKDYRAFSHGCVRVQDPFGLADVLLQSEPDWSGDKVRALVGGSQRRIELSRPIPVHLIYFTMTVDPNGTAIRHPDVYGYDSRLRKALGL